MCAQYDCSGALRRAVSCKVTDVLHVLTASIFEVHWYLISSPVGFCQTTRRNISEDILLHSHRSENVKYHSGYIKLRITQAVINYYKVAYKKL